MSTKHRRHYSSDFKAKVALEAIRETESIAELASKYSLHANQIQTWKREAVTNLSMVFESNSDKKALAELADLRSRDAHMTQLLGQQTLELAYLKKSSQRLNLQ